MLQGKTVSLRAWEREDVAAMRELTQRPEFVELMMHAGGSWEPTPTAGFEKEFDEYLAAPEKASFVIEVEGQPIGLIGLHNINRRAGTAEVGISILDSAAVGRGYGREAMRLLLDWAFRIRNFRRIWLQVSEANPRAIKSYQACGFVEEARLRQHDYYNGRYVDVLVMGILGSEWQTAPADSDSAG